MDAIATIKKHQSVRKFTGESISQEQLTQIEDAIIRTSSTCFFQLITTIEVSDKAKLQQIAALSGHQEHIAACSHFLFFCLDVTKLQHIEAMPKTLPFRVLFSGITDAGLYCQNALTAAESLGLGGVVISAFRVQIAKIAELLELPQGCAPLVGLCLGVPDPKFLEGQKPRLPRSWLIMKEHYQDPFDAAELKQYDEEMQRYYESRVYNQRSDNWTNSARNLGKDYAVKAPSLIAFFNAQGFIFE